MFEADKNLQGKQIGAETGNEKRHRKGAGVRSALGDTRASLLFLALCVIGAWGIAFLTALIGSQSIRTALLQLFTPGNLVGTVITAVLLLALCGLTRSLFWGNLVVGFPLLLLSAINYYKLSITAIPFTIGDFSLIGQAGDIAKLNRSSLYLTAAIVIAAVLWLLWMVVTAILSPMVRPTWRFGLSFGIGAAAFFLVFFWIFADAVVFAPLGVPCTAAMEPAAVNSVCGSPALGLWRNLRYQVNLQGRRVDALDLQEALDAMEKESGSAADGRAVHPNIVMLLSESFLDITRLPDVQFSSDPVSEFHALQQEGVSGRFYSSGFGYGTCSIELEILTGINTSLLNGENLYAMDPGILSKFSAVPFMLRQSGYYTSYLHPYNDSVYHREKLFSSLGFDDMFFIEDVGAFFEPLKNEENLEDALKPYTTGPYCSDDFLADLLIAEYEQVSEKDGPVFLYAASMENHTPYLDKYAPDELTVSYQAALSGESDNILKNVSQGISDASAALGKLADYFRTVDEPTIIVFYGDHRPGAGLTTGGFLYSDLGMAPYSRDTSTWSLQEKDELFSTDYLIWANDPTLLPKEAGSRLDQGCSYFGSTLLDLAGTSKNAYWKLISSLSEYRIADTMYYHLGADHTISDTLPVTGPSVRELGLFRDLLTTLIYGDGQIAGAQWDPVL